MGKKKHSKSRSRHRSEKLYIPTTEMCSCGKCAAATYYPLQEVVPPINNNSMSVLVGNDFFQMNFAVPVYLVIVLIFLVFLMILLLIFNSRVLF